MSRSTFEALTVRVDRFIDMDFEGYSGWHDRTKVGSPAYRPAIQQVRSEFIDFLRVCHTRRLAKPSLSMLQIGLGMGGGSHFAFSQVFASTTTIDSNPEVIDRYGRRLEAYSVAEGLSFEHEEGEARAEIVHGFSNTRGLLRSLRARGLRFDAVFIDGDHSLNGVATDWICYEPFVVPGGIVAFHDRVPQPELVHRRAVHVFVEWLLHQPFSPGTVAELGSELGIFYYVKETELVPCLTDSMVTGFLRMRDDPT